MRHPRRGSLQIARLGAFRQTDRGAQKAVAAPDSAWDMMNFLEGCMAPGEGAAWHLVRRRAQGGNGGRSGGSAAGARPGRARVLKLPGVSSGEALVTCEHGTRPPDCH